MKFIKIPMIYALVYTIISICFILLLIIGRLPIGFRSLGLLILLVVLNGVGMIFEIVGLVINRKRRLGILSFLIYLNEEIIDVSNINEEQKEVFASIFFNLLKFWNCRQRKIKKLRLINY